MEIMECYRERRPVLHYSVPKGWMNDPNGLIYHNGYYHLYYQHYPNGLKHGPMHWGHAKSRDLINWENLPIALYPDEKGTIFSGSMVYDANNSTGFAKDGKNPLVAIYTYHKQNDDGSYIQSQAIAYSLDDGLSFTKYDGNPVLTSKVSDFRDPKVFYYEETKNWIMPLAVERKIEFYTSPNLINWTYASEYTSENEKPEGIWECPDLCHIKVNGTQLSKWVLIYSVNAPDASYFGMQYVVGEFDGENFIPETPCESILMTDFAFDNYAAVTYGGIPDRTVYLGWMNCWHYADKIPCSDFRGSMVLPRELYLEENNGKYILAQKPVKELFENISSEQKYENIEKVNIPPAPVYLDVEHDAPVTITLKNDVNSFCIEITETEIIADRRGCGNENLGAAFYRTYKKAIKKPGSFSMLIDTTSIEIFADDGKAVAAIQVFTDKPFDILTASHEIKSITVKTFNNK